MTQESGELDSAWKHRSLLEQNFNSRLNFFLVFESILIAGAVNVSAATPPNPQVGLALCTFGVAATLLWGFVQVRELYYLSQVKKDVEEQDSTHRARVSNYKRGFGPQVNMVLTYWIPGAVLILWGVLTFLLVKQP